jgi:hypothetical protein
VVLVSYRWISGPSAVLEDLDRLLECARRVLEPAMAQIKAASGIEITCTWSSSVRNRCLDRAQLVFQANEKPPGQRRIDSKPLGPAAFRHAVDCGCC